MKHKSRLIICFIALIAVFASWVLNSCTQNADVNVGTYETDIYTPVETSRIPDYDQYDSLMTAFSNIAFTSDEFFEYAITDEEAVVTGLKKTDFVIVIPKYIEGKTVVGIADNAFKDNTFIKAVCVPETVSVIGDGAFSGCTGLTTVKLPINTVGDGNFARIFGSDDYINNAVKMPGSLETVIFTGSQADIPAYGFFSCSHLKNIILPEGVENIGKFAFYGCDSLEYIYLPESLKTVGEYAFAHCVGLRAIVLPSEVVSIGLGAYEDCSSVITLETPIFGGGTDHAWIGYIFGGAEYSWNVGYVPASLQYVKITGESDEVPPNAFYGCLGIVEIVLPESIKAVSIRAFYGCRGLASFELPALCGEIGDEAFYKCVGISEISGSNVKKIGMQAFYGCISLEKADFGGASEVGNSAFFGCMKLAECNVGNAQIGNDVFKNTLIEKN